MTVMLKLLGVCLMGVAGFALGFEKARVLWLRQTFWRELGRMLAQIRDEIQFRALPMPQLLCQLRDLGQYPHLGLESCQSLDCFAFPDYIPAGEAALFQPLFRCIGQVTSQELCEQMEYYLPLCQRSQEQVQQAYQAASRFYPRFGVCAGLLAALLLF